LKSGALAQSQEADIAQKDSGVKRPQNEVPSRAAAAQPYPEGRERKKLLTLVIGLFLLSALLGFIAFLIFGNGGSTGGESVSPPAREAQSAAANLNSNAGAASPNATVPAGNANLAPPDAGALSQANPPGEPTEETTEVDTGRAREQVAAVIEGWTSALESKNLNGHMRYFAPTLHTYFLANNVNRSLARATVDDYFKRYSSLDIQLGPPEVRVDSTGKRAIATFEKSWSFDGDQPSSGKTVERVWLRKTGNRWVITGVRDLR
jgi:hypothetical protein